MPSMMLGAAGGIILAIVSQAVAAFLLILWRGPDRRRTLLELLAVVLFIAAIVGICLLLR